MNMDHSNVLVAVAGAAAAAAFAILKRRRLPNKEAAHTPMPPGPQPFSIVAELLPMDELLDVVRLMPAASAARLAKVSTAARDRLLDPDVARWCAESRRQLLKRRQVEGDLPLAPPDAKWTLERLHLCEHPPRFPSIFFQFAHDEIDGASGAWGALSRVAALLRLHPKLTIRIHGYAQPDAPDTIGEALAQARATSVRLALLRLLRETPEFAAEDPHEGVRPNRETSPWNTSVALRSTRLVGRRVQAVGRWGHSPSNANFEDRDRAGAEEGLAAAIGADEQPHEGAGAGDGEGGNGGGAGGGDAEEVSSDDVASEEESDEDDEYGGRDRLRRAEFTLISLDG